MGVRSTLVESALDRVQLRRAPGLPRQIHLSVTDRCFLPCIHCDIWKNKTPDLPGSVWEDVIDRLGEWCAPAAMNFVGGEPLLRKDLESLMARAVERGFEVSFNTNGHLMTPDRAKAIHDAGVSIAYVSLDGIRVDTIDHSRGREGSHQKAMRAIELFQQHESPRVVIACILHAGNVAEIPELLSFVRERNLQVVFQPLYQNFGEVAFDPDWWKTSELWPHSPDQVQSLHQCLDRLSADRMRGLPICNDVAQLQAMKRYFEHPTRDSGQLCRAGHSDLSFDPKGQIRLCYFLEPVGSIFDPMPLSLRWESWTTLRRRWEVSRCERQCNLLNCNFDAE